MLLLLLSMKSKDYISHNNKDIKLDPKNLKSIQDPTILLKILHYVAIEQPFSPKKEKMLLQHIVDFHYDKAKLHEANFFRIFLLHVIKLNHFEIVQDLVKKNLFSDTMNKFLHGHDIWPSFNSHIDWQRKRLSYTPLIMASSVKNPKMFEFILNHSDLALQIKFNNFPLEQV